MKKLKKGVKSLASGSSGLTEGIEAFSGAIGKAQEGSSQLSEAMEKTAEAGGTLGSAFDELTGGLQGFADAISEFDEEGIQSLADLAGPDYLAVIRGLKAVREADLSYNNYSGILDGQEGSVRFIIETEEIE